jgi:hypothetical protein
MSETTATALADRDLGEANKIRLLEAVPLFSLRRLAEFFDCFTDEGKPATDTVLQWWHDGKIPPPDLRVTRKAIYWKPETVKEFIENGGNQ